MKFTNSPLVTYTKLTKNKTSSRKHTIDTITIHCICAQWTAKQGCDYFYEQGVLYNQFYIDPSTGEKKRKGRACSSNYVVGKDGSIGLCVEEKNRSWCTSSASNDHRAVTIEVASDTKHPYKVTSEAYNALIKLVADICERNHIKELKWKGDKNLIGEIDKQNMTVHMWFANKECPGKYLLDRHSDIAEKVNKLLNPSSEKIEKPSKPIEEVAKEVISGKWGNGETRKQKLTTAGYDYKAVQSIVNKLLTKTETTSKKSNDEIAKEVIKGLWGNGTERKEKLTKAGYDYKEIQKLVNKLVK